MPEYLAPGVYVEEIEFSAHPIPGVTATIDDATALAVGVAVRRVLRDVHPDWTDWNRADPGVALIELFAWLAENLVYRADASAERRAAAWRALTALTAQLTEAAPTCGPVKRPVFFTGRLLDAATFEAEQKYVLDKHRRQLRELHGPGIVHGLGVSIEGGAGAERLHVEPGYAIDGYGNDVIVCARTRVPLPALGAPLFLHVRRWDRLTDFVATGEGNTAGAIEEAALFGFAREVGSPAIAIARLVATDGTWTIDGTFTPPRSRMS